MGMRAKTSRLKRQKAVIDAWKEKRQFDLETVNSNLRPDLRFANRRELAQVVRQVRPLIPENLWILK